jgi:D-sedoheptulose 7-phosphate isomerase
MKDLLKLIKRARFIWICGNGGSAANAEHFTADLIKKRYSAICLSSNLSIITMLANDYDYKYIFSKQIEILSNSQDLIITISCSGISSNIKWAKYAAENMNIPIYSFETFHKNTFGDKRDYGLLEDKHLKFIHQVVKNL